MEEDELDELDELYKLFDAAELISPYDKTSMDHVLFMSAVERSFTDELAMADYIRLANAILEIIKEKVVE